MKQTKWKPFPDEILDTVLEDDDTPFGGISHPGETVFDFLLEIGEDDIDTLDKLNEALIECGIKPVKL